MPRLIKKMAEKGPSLGDIANFAKSLGISRKPQKKRKTVLKKRVKVRKKREENELKKGVDRSVVIKETKQEYRSLSEKLTKKKKLEFKLWSDRTAAYAEQLGLEGGFLEKLKAALSDAVDDPQNLELSVKQFNDFCTTKRKEIMSLALRSEVDEKLGIGEMRKELAKMELEKGLLSDEIDAEFAFEKNKKGSKDIEWSLENYKQYRPLLRLVSRKSGVSEKELLVFGTIESRFKKFAKNGSSKGLMQMQRAATIDSVKGLNADLKGAKKFAKNLHASELIYDPLINLILAVEYIKILKKVAIDNGINPVRISDIYTLFNQGASGGLKAMKNKGLINPAENPTHTKTKKKMAKMPWGDFEVS